MDYPFCFVRRLCTYLMDTRGSAQKRNGQRIPPPFDEFSCLVELWIKRTASHPNVKIKLERTDYGL